MNSFSRSASSRAPTVVGRYTLFSEIACGGMASVYLGRLTGQAGFSKTVAIKRPHPHLARNPEFAAMSMDEARLAARIQHPNVVATLDVVVENGEIFLIMDYVHGESLSYLLAAAAQRGVRVPPPVVGAIFVNVLHGLHAAHEATDESGHPLDIVHRDVSPQNVLVGVDGAARVLDFGVAKAAGQFQSTSEGQVKGKFAYMAPEQVSGGRLDRRTDVYAASAVLWGALAGRRLVEGRNEAEILNNVLRSSHAPPSAFSPAVSASMDAVVMRGLARDPAYRFQTARDMAAAVGAALGVCSPYEVGEWVKSLAAETITIRSQRIREMQSSSEVRVSTGQGIPVVVRNSSFDVHVPMEPQSTSPSAISKSNSRPLSLPPAVPSHTPPPPHPVTTMPAVHVPAGFDGGGGRMSASLIGVAAIVFSITFGGTLYWRYGRHLDRDNGAAPSRPSVVDAVESSVPMIVSPPVDASPSVALAPASASAPVSAKRPPPPSAPPPVAKKQKPTDCETSPFFVDHDRIKHVRPECM